MLLAKNNQLDFLHCAIFNKTFQKSLSNQSITVIIRQNFQNKIVIIKVKKIKDKDKKVEHLKSKNQSQAKSQIWSCVYISNHHSHTVSILYYCQNTFSFPKKSLHEKLAKKITFLYCFYQPIGTLNPSNSQLLTLQTYCSICFA